MLKTSNISYVCFSRVHGRIQLNDFCPRKASVSKDFSFLRARRIITSITTRGVAARVEENARCTSPSGWRMAANLTQASSRAMTSTRPVPADAELARESKNKGRESRLVKMETFNFCGLPLLRCRYHHDRATRYWSTGTRVAVCTRPGNQASELTKSK